MSDAEGRDQKLLRLTRLVLDIKAEKKEENSRNNKRIKELEAEIKVCCAE